MLRATLWAKYYYPHFIDEETSLSKIYSLLKIAQLAKNSTGTGPQFCSTLKAQIPEPDSWAGDLNVTASPGVISWCLQRSHTSGFPLLQHICPLLHDMSLRLSHTSQPWCLNLISFIPSLVDSLFIECSLYYLEWNRHGPCSHGPSCLPSNHSRYRRKRPCPATIRGSASPETQNFLISRPVAPFPLSRPNE